MARESVALIGDWPEANRIFRGLYVKMKRAGKESLREEAKLAARRIKANLKAGRYKFTPLAPGTTARRTNPDGPILIDTARMVNAIEAFEISSRNWGVGSRDLEMAQRMAAHEFGTSRIPQRPFLRVEITRIQSEGLKKIQKAFEEVLYR